MQKINFKSCLYFVLIPLFCLLSGCGFHLREPVILPPSFHTVYVQINDNYGDLALLLRQSLYEAGAKTVPTPDSAQINLVVQSENISQMTSSIASNSQITIINVTYTVKFQVTDTNDQVLLPPRTVTVRRSYSQNSNELLSVTNNLNILQHNMRIDAVQQIMAQITAKNALVALDVSNS